MKFKYLRVEMPDGSKWDVPAGVIAHDRALSFAGGVNTSDVFRNEYDYTLKNDYELKDWASNNMNWSDVWNCAEMVQAPQEVNFQEGWMNGDKEIVEK